MNPNGWLGGGYEQWLLTQLYNLASERERERETVKRHHFEISYAGIKDKNNQYICLYYFLLKQ